MIRKRFGIAVGRVVLPRNLDGGLIGLGSGIGEEHHVGEAVVDEPLRQTFAFRNLVQVGGVPELSRLFGQCLHQMRVRVAEGIDRDTGAKIEISLAISTDEPSSLPSFKGEVGARVGLKQGRCHEVVSALMGPKIVERARKRKRRPVEAAS